MIRAKYQFKPGRNEWVAIVYEGGDPVIILDTGCEATEEDIKSWIQESLRLKPWIDGNPVAPDMYDRAQSMTITRGGPTYIPHLRKWVIWEYDMEEWPFRPLVDHESETEEQYKQRRVAVQKVLRYGQHWLEVPDVNEPEYQEYQRNYQENYLRDMADLGYWDLDGQKPIPKAMEFKVVDFPENAMMAHVLHRAGLFSSVGEARRNGWNKPIQPGDYVVGKKKQRVRIL